MGTVGNITVVSADLKYGPADGTASTPLGYTKEGATVSISRDITKIKPNESLMAIDATVSKLTIEITADLVEYDATFLAKIFSAIDDEPEYFSLLVTGTSTAGKTISFTFPRCYCPEASIAVKRGGAWVYPLKALAILKSTDASLPTVDSNIAS